MKEKTLSKRLFRHTIILLFLGVSFISALWIYNIITDYNRDIEALKQDHTVEQKNLIKNSVEILVKMINEDKKITKDQLVEMIVNMRYGKNGYFWINDLEPKMIMHPITPSLNNKYIGDYKDPNGKPLFLEMVKKAKQSGEGFVQYHWLKPDDGIVKDKISFVKTIDKFNWIIGTGIYLDDIENMIEVKKEKLKDEIITFQIVSVVITLILVIIAYFVINIYYKNIKESFEEFERFAQNSFESSEVLDSSTFVYKEFQGLADSINNMVEQRLEYEKKITDFNEELELEVQSRTKELQQNYKKLQETQAQLIQSEKMAGLGSLVAGVSHEINTPIGVALTATTHTIEELNGLEKSYKEGKMSEEQFLNYLKDTRESDDAILKNLLRAAELIKSFKQVAVDQSSDEFREFRLKKYINEILSSLHHKIKKTKLEVDIDIDEQLVINSNPGFFSQVLTNLIMNSIIHGFKENEEGTIKISARLFGRELILIYEDSGKGLDNTTKEKIFDPFYTTNRAKGGSGLGMNIVYNLIVNKLGGSILVKQKSTKGVLFEMKFKV